MDPDALHRNKPSNHRGSHALRVSDLFRENLFVFRSECDRDDGKRFRETDFIDFVPTLFWLVRNFQSIRIHARRKGFNGGLTLIMPRILHTFAPFPLVPGATFDGQFCERSKQMKCSTYYGVLAVMKVRNGFVKLTGKMMNGGMTTF